MASNLCRFAPFNSREETGELFSDKLKAFTLEVPDYTKKSQADCKTKERIEIAPKLKAAGSPIELIMQVTGLSQEEIEQL